MYFPSSGDCAERKGERDTERETERGKEKEIKKEDEQLLLRISSSSYKDNCPIGLGLHPYNLI